MDIANIKRKQGRSVKHKKKREPRADETVKSSFFDAQMAGLAFLESMLTQMRDKGISKEELAARLGRTTAYVENLFRNSKLTFQAACELASAVGLHFMPTLCRDTKVGLERSRGLLDDVLPTAVDDADIAFPVVIHEPD